MIDSSTSCSNCQTTISRQCQKKDRNNNLTPATGCIGWSTQDGGICCEPEKDDDGIWGTIAKVAGGILAGAVIPAAG